MRAAGEKHQSAGKEGFGVPVCVLERVKTIHRGLVNPLEVAVLTTSEFLFAYRESIAELRSDQPFDSTALSTGATVHPASCKPVSAHASPLHLLQPKKAKERTAVISCRYRLMGFDHHSPTQSADLLQMQNLRTAPIYCLSRSAAVGVHRSSGRATFIETGNEMREMENLGRTCSL